ncbi:MAG: hypothetical protein Q4B14_04840 [Clostridia bacterium]|nr:hypothetical protein [Clostridia bacterium]
MKNNRRFIFYIVYIILGATLFILGLLEILDSFWSGMGGALVAMGSIRMVLFLRYRNDESYWEKQEIEIKDERNQFIRNKAWSWAGYLFVLISAISTIIFKLSGQELLSTAAGFAVCIIITLYWICYLIIKNKY